jgi:hypothetical protein
MLLTASNGANLRQSIQRISTLLKEESELSEIQLDIDIIPIREEGESEETNLNNYTQER